MVEISHTAGRPIAGDIRSQYLISYNPNNKGQGGFHEIVVRIPERPDLKVRTRPGYWVAAR